MAKSATKTQSFGADRTIEISHKGTDYTWSAATGFISSTHLRPPKRLEPALKKLLSKTLFPTPPTTANQESDSARTPPTAGAQRPRAETASAVEKASHGTQKRRRRKSRSVYVVQGGLPGLGRKR
jgi:hypothetical protein